MDPLEELNKASRSCRVSIYNTTNKKLVLKSHPIVSGNWRVQPPENILPLSTAEFGSESGMMGGTEAGSIYVMDGSEGTFEFFWNIPLFGKKGYRRVAPAGYESEYTVVDTHNCVLKFIVKELDNGMKEAEDIEKEIRDFQIYINDTDNAIKGMTKMAQVYLSQKDEKQSRLVENNIKEKTRHLEEMKARKQQLENEIQRMKLQDSDPKVMEQQLSKIRESIESLVKQRKGMEHMREVYERSKDVKSMEGLDKQVETKKGEIEAMRKKEQKVIQKVIELKKSMGLGATGILTKKKVIALFDYAKSTEDELSIKTGDIIDIIHDEDPDWYGGSLRGQMGYFPKAFVGDHIVASPLATPTAIAASVPVQQQIEQQPSSSSTLEEGGDVYTGEDFSHLYPKARVVYDHEPADEGEIALRVGDIITVYSWETDYWWEGVNSNGKTGYFPNTCVDWVEPETTDVDDYSNYSYYESTEDDQSAAAAHTTPVKNVTPTPIQPPPTAFTAPNLKATLTPKRDLPTAPSKSTLTTPVTPTTPAATTTTKPITTAPVVTPLVAKPTQSVAPNVVKPVTPTVVTPTPVTPIPTPVIPTQAPVIPTAAVPSKPITSSASIASSSPMSTQFDKLIQPLITDFTKKLVEAHQKETALLNQKISALEKELRELKESTNNGTNIRTSVTSTATVISKASPAVRKY